MVGVWKPNPLSMSFSVALPGLCDRHLPRPISAEQVVSTEDAFHLGPINSADSEARVQWLDETLGVIGWGDLSRIQYGEVRRRQ